MVWVGSYGKGFYAIHNGRLISMPLDKNNYLGMAHTFLEDQHGYLWITTNRGLFQVSQEEIYKYLENPTHVPYYHYYDNSDGLLTNEFNGGCNPSGIKLNNGKFSFPSLKSLVQFHPDSIKPILPKSRIFIEAIFADSMKIDPSAALNLPENINRLQFHVSSPYFGNAYNQQIEYQLNGLDSIWYPVNEDGIILFNRLTSGKYKLMLRKKSGFGENDLIVNQLSFEIVPAFYSRWAFKSLLAALFLLICYFMYRFRIRFILNQKRLLENEVLNRTLEQKLLIENLENTIAELDNSNEQLYQNKVFKERLTMIIMHDLQSPLRFLYDATRRAHEQYKYSELSEINLELFNATGKIYSFVNDFGWWLNSLGENFKPQYELIDLSVLLEELNQFFSEQLKVNRNKLFFSFTDIQFITSDRQLLKIILRNILDNANKHTLNGRIEIKTSSCHGLGKIEISDTGSGIDHALLAKLQARLKEKSIDYSEVQNGFGFRFIADLSHLLNLDISLTSEKGIGTVVTVTNLKITTKPSIEVISKQNFS